MLDLVKLGNEISSNAELQKFQIKALITGKELRIRAGPKQSMTIFADETIRIVSNLETDLTMLDRILGLIKSCSDTYLPSVGIKEIEVSKKEEAAKPANVIIPHPDDVPKFPTVNERVVPDSSMFGGDELI